MEKQTLHLSLLGREFSSGVRRGPGHDPVKLTVCISFPRETRVGRTSTHTHRGPSSSLCVQCYMSLCVCLMLHQGPGPAQVFTLSALTPDQQTKPAATSLWAEPDYVCWILHPQPDWKDSPLVPALPPVCLILCFRLGPVCLMPL